MCGRVVVDYEESLKGFSDTEFVQWLSGGLPEGYEPSWNIKPTQSIPVAFTDREGRNRFEYAYWSLVPPWAKEMKSRYPTFNARAETAGEKPTFRGPVKSARCIVPVTGFYEWTGPKTSRTPHAIFGPQPVLPMAGLYSWWHEPGADDDDGWHLTTTILTRSSAGVMENLHDRMPVFMAGDLVEEWLDPALVGDQGLVDAVSAAAVPISEQLREWKVRPLRGDGPELIEPA